MQVFRVIIFLIYIIIGSNVKYVLKAQDSIKLTINEVYNIAIQKINLSCVDWKYDDSIKSSYFDFRYFSSSNSLVPKGISYISYYKNKQLLKLSQINSINNKICDFYFFYYNDLIYYIANFHNKEFLISSIRGFFVYDKKIKLNYYFGISDEFIGITGIEEKTNREMQLQLTKNHSNDINKLRTIILFDDYLNPTNRINCSNCKIVSYSYFMSENDELEERIAIIDNCESENFKEKKFKDLWKIIRSKNQKSIFIFFYKIPKKPIWSLPNLGY